MDHCGQRRLYEHASTPGWLPKLILANRGSGELVQILATCPFSRLGA